LVDRRCRVKIVPAEMEIEIPISLLILLAMFLLATIDMAFTQLSDVSLRRLTSDTEENPRVNTEFMREIIADRAGFRFSISAAIQILLIIFSVLVTITVYNFETRPIYLLIDSLLIGLLLSGVFRQILPRLITWQNPENKLIFLLPLVKPIYRLLSFIADPFRRFMLEKEQQRIDTMTTMDLIEEKEDDNVEDIQALIEMGEAEGIIEEEEREMIETMVELSDTRTGEIMTPRTEICALPVTATIRDARNLINEQKYSRIPVYGDSIDDIKGILYVRDLLEAWSKGTGEEQPVSSVLREAFFVPETKTASELLKSMQQNHVQIAIVIDEYGGVAGLITVEDILEEIVGELEDEDIEAEEIIEIVEGSEGYWDVLGSTDIDKVERLFDLDIEDEDFTTVAGFVTSEAGYVPRVGEKLNIRGLEIEVLRGDEKRLSLLRVRRQSPGRDTAHYA
jgi:putative hemolysin